MFGHIISKNVRQDISNLFVGNGNNAVTNPCESVQRLLR